MCGIVRVRGYPYTRWTLRFCSSLLLERPLSACFQSPLWCCSRRRIFGRRGGRGGIVHVECCPRGARMRMKSLGASLPAGSDLVGLARKMVPSCDGHVELVTFSASRRPPPPPTRSSLASKLERAALSWRRLMRPPSLGGVGISASATLPYVDSDVFSSGGSSSFFEMLPAKQKNCRHPNDSPMQKTSANWQPPKPFYCN